MDFIKIKRDGTSVTGANISIRLTNEFMEAVEKNSEYVLTFPVDRRVHIDRVDNQERNKLVKIEDNLYIKIINAKEYWEEIIKSAKNYAEPGLMYWDSVIDNDPASVYPEFTPTSSNPCGEQFLNPNDSCRLIALNLFSFVDFPFTSRAAIDYEKLYKVSYEQARIGDNLVDLELKYIQRIIDKIKSDPEPDNIKRGELELWEKSYNKTKAGRRIGLGITALADMIAALNLPYDSDLSIEIIEKVMAMKMQAELDCSIDLSILRGPFKGWDYELEFTNNVEENGADKYLTGNNNFYTFLQNRFPKQVKKMIYHGRRNVSWSTIAPTGSVSLLSKTTSGCEPIFYPYHMRRKKINPSEDGIRVDFVDEIGDSWQEFPVLHEKFKDWIYTALPLKDTIENYNVEDFDKSTLKQMFEKSPWFGSTANDIDWEKRNKIQSVLQKYTTNAISSTINLPSTVTEKEVSDIYLNGWKFGLKGQTVYVDGSRSGVLVTDETKQKSNKFEYKDAIKRPQSLVCDLHTTTTAGNKYNVIIGLLDGKPYEVFISEYFTNESKSIIKKVNQGRYDLIKEDGEILRKSITASMTESEEVITRLVSMNLRHGGDIKYVVEQINKTPSDNMFTFTKSLARVLKKYIPDGVKSTVKCQNPDCTGDGSNVIFEEGCNKCMDCGSSKCG